MTWDELEQSAMTSPTKSMRQKVAARRERWIDSITSFIIVDKPETLLCLTVGFFVVAMMLV